ncbi:Coiled-coil domain-containing protein 114 [Plecturocebus cupreus]
MYQERGAAPSAGILDSHHSSPGMRGGGGPGHRGLRASRLALPSPPSHQAPRKAFQTPPSQPAPYGDAPPLASPEAPPFTGSVSISTGGLPFLARMPLGHSAGSARSEEGSEAFLDGMVDWELSQLQRQCKVMEEERRAYSKEVHQRINKQL